MEERESAMKILKHFINHKKKLSNYLMLNCLMLNYQIA